MASRRPVAPARCSAPPSDVPDGRPTTRTVMAADDASDDHEHLLHVGPGDGLHAADQRVAHGRHAHRQHGQRQVPVEDHREDHRRRRQDRAAGQAAREQEQQAGQRARLHVEAPLEVLVRGVDAGPVEERDHRDREDDHRQRQPEIQLQHAHAFAEAAPGRADQGDRGELCRHHRQADGPPRQAAVGEEVAFDLVGAVRAADAVRQDPGEVGSDDDPVDEVHAGSADRIRPARRWSGTTRGPAG